MTELASWKSHKIVKAGEIVRIDATYNREGSVPAGYRVHCKAADESAGVVIIDAPAGLFARLIAETGGTSHALGQMLVIYEGDGYMSWSPKDTFIAGYDRLGEPDGRGGYIGLERQA